MGIALAAAGSGETGDSLLDRADAALYGSKAEGRDQVTLSPLSAVLTGHRTGQRSRPPIPPQRAVQPFGQRGALGGAHGFPT